MKFASEEHKSAFEIPDKLTVRDILRYDSKVEFSDEPLYPRLWLGVIEMAENWESQYNPDPKKVDLDADLDPYSFGVIKWAGIALSGISQN